MCDCTAATVARWTAVFTVAVGVPAAIEEDLQGHVPRIPKPRDPFWPSTPGRAVILPAALRPIGQHPAVQRETTGSVQLDAVQGDEPHSGCGRPLTVDHLTASPGHVPVP